MSTENSDWLILYKAIQRKNLRKRENHYSLQTMEEQSSDCDEIISLSGGEEEYDEYETHLKSHSSSSSRKRKCYVMSKLNYHFMITLLHYVSHSNGDYFQDIVAFEHFLFLEKENDRKIEYIWKVFISLENEERFHLFKFFNLATFFESFSGKRSKVQCVDRIQDAIEIIGNLDDIRYGRKGHGPKHRLCKACRMIVLYMIKGNTFRCRDGYYVITEENLGLTKLFAIALTEDTPNEIRRDRKLIGWEKGKPCYHGHQNDMAAREKIEQMLMKEVKKPDFNIQNLRYTFNSLPIHVLIPTPPIFYLVPDIKRVKYSKKRPREEIEGIEGNEGNPKSLKLI